MRPLIEKSLEVLEKEARKNKPPRLVVDAPPSYGKSTAAPLMAKILIESEWCYNFIHSLPLRAIVEDLYLCLLVNSLIDDPGLRNKCKKREDVLRIVRKALTSVNIDADSVAYQMGDIISVNSEPGIKIRKEPLFNANYIVTTLDSLAYNVFRVPVTEVFDPHKHYAIPRARIYTSAIYFDEAHMIYEEYKEENTMITVFDTMLEIFNKVYIPIIVASATLSKSIEEHLHKTLENCKIVKLGDKDEERNSYIVVRDKDFEDDVKSVKWITEFLDEKDLVAKVKELLEIGLRVFIARDTIRNAIASYREFKSILGLKDEEIVLLHSLMTREDRRKALEKLRNAKVLVATSIVEAGVDISFDVLITDASRPPSIIQRTGRICRDLNRCEGKEAFVYILRNDHLDRNVKEFIEKNDKRICWRLPYSVFIDNNRYSGYESLLNMYSYSVSDRIDLEFKRKLEALATPLLISSDTINRILERLNYRLTRTFLAEVFVGDPRSIESKVDFNKVSFVTSLDRIELLAAKECIDGLYVALGHRNNAEVKKLRDITSLKTRRGELNTKEYFRVVEELRRNSDMKYKAIAIAFLLNRVCYNESEGVKYDVLRL